MYNDSRRELFYIIAASTILHLIIIVLFLLSKLDDSIREFKSSLIEKKLRQAQKKQAKVIFKQPKQKKQKKLIPKLSGGNPGLSKISMPSKQSQKPTPKIKIEKKEPSQKKPINQKKEPEKKIEPPKEPTEIKPPKKITVKKPVKQIKIKPYPTTISKKLYPSKPKEKPVKKKVTLKDITKGFMEYARRETVLKNPSSNHLISISAKKFGQATAEQLKHERYIKKLFDCVDISFKLLKRKFRFTRFPNNDILRLFVLMDLKENGQIMTFKLVEPSGNAQFDMFMTKVFKDAARSFPPVPSSFKTEIYSLPIQCHIPVGILRPERKQMCV